MKKIYLLLFVNVLVGSLIAQSPITLGNTNMPGNGDTLRLTNVQLSSLGNYTQTGTNFNWNFSNVVSTTEDIREFKSAVNTPYFLYFLSSGEYGEKIADTLVGGTGTLSITKYYDFYKKQTTPVNAFIADGAGMTISNIPVPSYYSDKDELYVFPMSYPKYDSTTFKFSTLSTTLIPIRYSKAGYRVTVVDGWGTVTTPYGTQNCLRLITTQYSKDTTVITLPIANFPPIKIGIDNFVRSYQWMTLTSKIPYMEVTGNLVGGNFTLTQARYRGYNKGEPLATGLTGLPGGDSDVLIYPNPVKEKLGLSKYLAGAQEIEIFSSNGQLVLKRVLNSQNGSELLDVSGLEAGVYFLKMTTEGEQRHLKFVKE